MENMFSKKKTVSVTSLPEFRSTFLSTEIGKIWRQSNAIFGRSSKAHKIFVLPQCTKSMPTVLQKSLETVSAIFNIGENDTGAAAPTYGARFNHQVGTDSGRRATTNTSF